MSMFLRLAVLVTGLLALVPGTALAATFTVNSTGNNADADVGNGLCATSDGQCTLRAAIQEANATPVLDTIGFALGGGPQRISVPASLPVVTAPIAHRWLDPARLLQASR